MDKDKKPSHVTVPLIAHAQHALNDFKCMLSVRLKYKITNIRPKHKSKYFISLFLSHFVKNFGDEYLMPRSL